MTSVRSTAAAAAVKAPVVSAANAFTSFQPSSLRKLRDGGSVLVDGKILGGVRVTIRLDGAVNSPTRGKFFVITHPVRGGSEAGRPLSKKDLGDLNKAITAYMAKTPGRQPEYADFNARIRAALGGDTKKIDVAKIPTSVVGPNANASVEGSLWVNLMPGPGPRKNEVLGSVKIQGNGFNDAPPDYGVKKIEVYEKGTNKLVATLNNPKVAEDGRVGRGTHYEQFALKIDGSKLDQSKQYAFVFTATINGSEPMKVRSDFMSILKAY